MSSSFLYLVALLLVALAVDMSAWSPGANTGVSRRQAMQQTVATTTAATTGLLLPLLLPQIAQAGVAGENEPRITTRMGGLLESFQDGPRGLRLQAPSGWNRFDGEVGAYDLKWQDLVDPTENIKISSTPVKSTTESVAALGPVQDVGAALAAKRNAQLLSATERVTEDVLFYTFDFAIGDGTHQLLLLCVCKGRLWSVDANAKEKRWKSREEMYKNVLGSFVPKLNP